MVGARSSLLPVYPCCRSRAATDGRVGALARRRGSRAVEHASCNQFGYQYRTADLDCAGAVFAPVRYRAGPFSMGMGCCVFGACGDGLRSRLPFGPRHSDRFGRPVISPSAGGILVQDRQHHNRARHPVSISGKHGIRAALGHGRGIRWIFVPDSVHERPAVCLHALCDRTNRRSPA